MNITEKADLFALREIRGGITTTKTRQNLRNYCNTDIRAFCKFPFLPRSITVIALLFSVVVNLTYSHSAPPLSSALRNGPYVRPFVYGFNRLGRWALLMRGRSSCGDGAAICEKVSLCGGRPLSSNNISPIHSSCRLKRQCQRSRGLTGT